MENLNEYKDQNNFSKIDSMTKEERYEWYLIIKNSLDKLARICSDEEMDRLENAIENYEQRHGLGLNNE